MDTITGLFKTHDLDFTLDDVSIYFFGDLPKFNISKEEMLYYHETIKPKYVKLFPNAYHGIDMLQKDNDVFFLTSKSEEMMKWTNKVLKREKLSHIPVKISYEKQLEDFDLLIEDCGLTWAKCKEVGKECWLINRKYNQMYTEAMHFEDLYQVAVQLMFNVGEQNVIL